MATEKDFSFPLILLQGSIWECQHCLLFPFSCEMSVRVMQLCIIRTVDHCDDTIRDLFMIACNSFHATNEKKKIPDRRNRKSFFFDNPWKIL